jgi:transcriptional regulator with XRE-family HTH domain
MAKKEIQDASEAISELMDGLAQFEQTHYARVLDLKLDLSRILLEGLRQTGWTQKQLAEAVGTKEAYINRVAHASQNCTLEVVGRICHALGVKPRLIKEPRFEIVTTTPLISIKSYIKNDLSENIHGNKPIYKEPVSTEEEIDSTKFRAA